MAISEASADGGDARFERLDEFDARFTSISYVIELEPDDRRALLTELHEIVAGVDPLVIPLPAGTDAPPSLRGNAGVAATTRPA